MGQACEWACVRFQVTSAFVRCTNYSTPHFVLPGFLTIEHEDAIVKREDKLWEVTSQTIFITITVMVSFVNYFFLYIHLTLYLENIILIQRLVGQQIHVEVQPDPNRVLFYLSPVQCFGAQTKTPNLIKSVMGTHFSNTVICLSALESTLNYIKF